MIKKLIWSSYLGPVGRVLTLSVYTGKTQYGYSRILMDDETRYVAKIKRTMLRKVVSTLKPDTNAIVVMNEPLATGKYKMMFQQMMKEEFMHIAYDTARYNNAVRYGLHHE